MAGNREHAMTLCLSVLWTHPGLRFRVLDGEFEEETIQRALQAWVKVVKPHATLYKGQYETGILSLPRDVDVKGRLALIEALGLDCDDADRFAQGSCWMDGCTPVQPCGYCERDHGDMPKEAHYDTT